MNSDTFAQTFIWAMHKRESILYNYSRPMLNEDSPPWGVLWQFTHWEILNHMGNIFSSILSALMLGGILCAFGESTHFCYLWLCSCCCCCQVASVVSDSVRPQTWQPTRLHRPWDSPGKNTGVGCHFLLQCMKVKSEREVAQSCPTPNDPMDCSPPGSSVHGIFQARVLEWGAMAFSIALRGYLFLFGNSSKVGTYWVSTSICCQTPLPPPGYSSLSTHSVEWVAAHTLMAVIARRQQW